MITMSISTTKPQRAQNAMIVSIIVFLLGLGAAMISTAVRSASIVYLLLIAEGLLFFGSGYVLATKLRPSFPALLLFLVAPMAILSLGFFLSPDYWFIFASEVAISAGGYLLGINAAGSSLFSTVTKFALMASVIYMLGFRIIPSKLFDKAKTSFAASNASSFRFNTLAGLIDVNGNKTAVPGNKVKVTVLDFYFENCLACVKKLPLLDQLKNNYKGRAEVKIMHINAGNIDGYESFKTFVKQQPGDSENFLYDAEGKVTQQLGIRSFPTELIIDEHGKVLRSLTGYTHALEMDYLHKTEDIIDQLLLHEK
jgi:thiol-disulfide isomerase/thioredoxin